MSPRVLDLADKSDGVGGVRYASEFLGLGSQEESPTGLTRGGRRVVYAIVCTTLMMVSIDQTIVATALTTIQGDLHTSINWSSWTISVYALGMLVTSPTAGAIADQFGRERIFVSAIVIFTVASLCCSIAGNIYILIAFRTLQAVGGGAFMPCATGIISDHFGRERDRAIGMFASVFPIGAIIGPILGGIFVHYWSWRMIFLINVPIGTLLLVVAWKFLPRTEPRGAGHADLNGAVMLVIAVLSAMYGITSLGSSGHGFQWTFVAAEAVAFVVGSLFVMRASWNANSLIPINLLRGNGFAIMNLINFLYGATAIGLGALVPFYADLRYGIPPIEAGALLTARAAGMIALAGLSVMALRRTGYRLPMLIGFLLISAGFVGLFMHPRGMSPHLWLTIWTALTGVGMGVITPAANNASLQLARESISAIAGLRVMFRQSGAIAAVSIASVVCERSVDPADALAFVYLGSVGLMVVIVCLVFWVPEHRDSW